MNLDFALALDIDSNSAQCCSPLTLSCHPAVRCGT